ncbi:AIM24 family protein [Clostridium chromiireducens]|uniref:AIM24 family protein n=1 Tax=Clostridium chromiireducens TaxID=225345 RepID=A0A964W365_9CLOT|nr:AIM24 family protein [Clostridium chromiireducens]MVX64792.1 AIM24 family protein [Clostridium chromiireducens]
MVKCKNLFENKNIEVIESKGDVKVIEYKKDLSVNTTSAMTAYFASEMNVRRRQVLIELNGNAYTISAGAMQWTAGAVSMGADVKGFGDLLGKALSSKVTKESAIKPKYQGNGLLMLEPTYKHILLEEVSEWDGMVLDDGLFLACDSRIQQKVVARTNLSSAVLGKEGLFNLCLKGQGIAVLESPVPRDELIEFVLEDDEVKIDGNFAIAWSNSLEFRVEKSGKSLIGSAVSGEGFVNVYRGTGKILMAPIA